MFRCQKCQRQSSPGEATTRVVVAYRTVTYVGAGEERSGREPVRELLVCAACAPYMQTTTNDENKTVGAEGAFTARMRSEFEEELAPREESMTDDGRVNFRANVLPRAAVEEEDVFWNFDPTTNSYVPDAGSRRHDH